MTRPIGLFDSGIGGTSVWIELVKALPFENTLLIADSLNAPYGNKSKDEIIALCEKNTQCLLNYNCKVIVVACNTATTNAIAHLRKKYDIPFVGIEPAVKPASIRTQSKVIGVLATQGTLSSELFHQTSQRYAQEQGIVIIEQIGHGLVELIESGELHSTQMHELLKQYLLPMVNRGIDHLVLGCTHYPYLIPIIRKIIPAYITIIDSGNAVARQTKNILQQFNILNTNEQLGQHLWLTNAHLDHLKTFAPEGVSVCFDPLIS